MSLFQYYIVFHLPHLDGEKMDLAKQLKQWVNIA